MLTPLPLPPSLLKRGEVWTECARRRNCPPRRLRSAPGSTQSQVHQMKRRCSRARVLESLSSPTIHNPVRRRFAELADECDEIPATTLLSAQDLRATGMRDDNKRRSGPVSTANSVQFDMTHFDLDRTNSLSDTCAHLERRLRLRVVEPRAALLKKPFRTARSKEVRGECVSQSMQHEKRCVQVATDSIRMLAERVSSMNTENKPNTARLCDEAVTSIPAARLDHEIPVFHWSSTRSWQRRKVQRTAREGPQEVQRELPKHVRNFCQSQDTPSLFISRPRGVYPRTYEGTVGRNRPLRVAFRRRDKICTHPCQHFEGAHLR